MLNTVKKWFSTMGFGKHSQLKRVESHIEDAVLAFCKTRLAQNPYWFMSDLARHMKKYPGLKAAPSSADRVLRSMRARGIVDYYCASRALSYYKIVSVKEG